MGVAGELSIGTWRAARSTGRLTAWLAERWQDRSPAGLSLEEWAVHMRALVEASKIRETMAMVGAPAAMFVCNRGAPPRKALPAPQTKQESLAW